MPDSHRKMLLPDVAGHYVGMNKVLAYIDNNLKDDLSLNTLARVSGYSEYHFHRIFHALTGKTLHEYVCDRRIVAAAARLLYEPGSVTRIAYDCGFSSSSSFGRCFKKQLGCSPSQYRQHKERKRPLNQADGEVLRMMPNHEMEPTLNPLRGFRAAHFKRWKSGICRNEKWGEMTGNPPNDGESWGLSNP